jgi:O-antigen/teichoic acid export membrane protein
VRPDSAGAPPPTTQAVPGRPPLARNTLLNLAGQVIPLVVAVVAIPLIVRGLGPARFGILSLVWVVVGYASIFDLGLGRAATKRVAEALGRGEASVVPQVAWTAMLAQTITGVAGGLVLAALVPTIAGRLLKIPPGLVAEATGSFYVLALDIPAILVLSSLRGVLEASQRFDLVNAIRVPLATSNFVLPLAGVLLGWDLPRIVALLVLSTFAGAFAYYRVCARVFPELRAGMRFHRREFRELIGFGSWVTVSSVIGPLLVYSDRILLGALVSVAAVGLYAAPYEMITRTWLIPTSLVATLFPAFATLGAQGHFGELKPLIAQSIKFIVLGVGPVAMISVALAPLILTLWLGPRFSKESADALRILAIGVLVNCIAWVPYSLIQALNRPDVTAKIHLAELPVHLVLAWILVGALGVFGAALAWSLRVSLDAVLLFWTAQRMFPVSMRSVISRKLIVAVLLLAAGTLSMVAIRAVTTAPWGQLLATAAVLIGVAAAEWQFALDVEERERVGRILQLHNALRA